MSDEIPHYCSADFIGRRQSQDGDLPVGNLVGEEGAPSNLALDPEFFWKNGQKLRVRFLNGSSYLQDRVRGYAQEWTRHANIDFVFVSDGEAQIRVAFNWRNEDKSDWSQVGTAATKFVLDPNQPTMNLGSLTDGSRDDEICRVVLHEFGHALGCVHEHQSLAADLQWNEERVIADAKKFYHWSERETRTQILNKEVTATVHSVFDPNSIMCYMIPPQWTKDGRGINKNFTLSETDISFIRKVYPFRTRDAGRLGVDPDIRKFYPPLALNSKVIEFDPPYPLAPRIALGLTLLDVAKTANIRVRVHTPPQSQRNNKSFTLNLDAWADTELYNAAATWLEFVKGEVEYEVGQFDTSDNRPFDQPQPIVDGQFRRDVQHVDFPRGKYTEAPNVIVWLNALDLSKDFNWRIRAAARNVTAAGFDVVIESWANTVVHSASAAWVAYPKNHSGVVGSGVVSSSTDREWFPPRAENGGRVKFDRPSDRPDPKVFIALSELDMDNSRNLRVKVFADKIDDKGFNWHGNAWADSILYIVGANWIAFG